MLVARGQRQVGSACLRWAHVFTGAGWFQIVQCDGIVCDTRVSPPASAPPKPIVCIELMVKGTFHAFGALEGTYGERTAIAMRHEHYEGASGRRPFSFRMDGGELVVVELHLTEKLVGELPALPARLELGDATWTAAMRAGLLSEVKDDAVIAACAREIIAELAVRGILTKEGAEKALRPPSAAMARVWRALQPTIEHLALAVTAGDLGAAADVPVSRMERIFRRWATTFALVGPGLRSVTHNLRLKTAVLFLSADDATVASVAAATGYGSADAMTRAFRDAGFPPPSVVREELRASAGPAPAEPQR